LPGGNDTDFFETAAIATDGTVAGTNYLGVIVLSILFGSILNSIGDEVSPKWNVRKVVSTLK